MVNFVDSDGDIRSTNVQDAVNILNSGQINFETFSASGPSLAASTIEVNLITNYSGNAVVSPRQHGLNDPTFGSTVFVNDSGPYLAFTGSSQSRLKGIAVGNIVSTIIHESLHHTDGIGQAYNATISGLNAAIGSTSGAPAAFSGMTPDQVQQVRNIVEEQIVRNAVDLIDTVSNTFSRSGGRGYNDIQTIVDSYGDLLDPVQKAHLVSIVPSILENAQIQVNGVLYGRLPNGQIGVIHPSTGTIQDLPPAGSFIDDLRSAGQAILDLVVDAANAIGNAISNGIEAVGNAISSAVNAIGDFFNGVVDFFSGNNDINEGSASDDDNGKPLILDLDGDGVEINVRGDVSFDMDGDGFLEQTAWVDADDAFLVIDLNSDGSRGVGDGVIDQTDELILTEWVDWNGATDLQALATFDQWASRGGNNDGILNHLDSIWSELRVWQDVNQNGRSDAGELRTLAQLGITEIALTYDDGTGFSDIENDIEVLDSVLLGTSSIVRNGVLVEGAVGDVSLSYGAMGTRTTDTGYGYSVEFEDGSVWTYAETEGLSADVNLLLAGHRGAFGDARANLLTAHGSSHAVHLEGFDGHDTLIGGAGDDLLAGGSGDDLVSGGDGDDTLRGGTGVDELRGGMGDDTYLFELGDDALTIDESAFLVTSNGVTTTSTDVSEFSDVFVPPSGKDLLGHTKWVHDTQTGAVVESLAGGQDTLKFGQEIGISDLVWSSNHTVPEFFGDTDLDYDMTIEFLNEDEEIIQNTSVSIRNWGDTNFQIDQLAFSSGATLDLTYGGVSSYKPILSAGLSGSATNDVIDVGAVTPEGNPLIGSYFAGVWITALGGNDTIYGSVTQDIINGGSGDDTLTGGITAYRGSQIDDIFIFSENDGNDIITDFEVGVDRVIFDVNGLRFDDLEIVSGASGAVVDYGGGNTITFMGINESSLTESDFEFF